MSTRDHTRWSRIERELALTLEMASDIHVSLVWNEPDENALAVDYDWHSILTEYLDDGEKSELLTGLRDAGFAVSVYEGERAFLAAVLKGEWQAIKFSTKYVFNTTGSGSGRARTSLVPAFCDLCQIPICSADGLTAGLLENKFYTFRLLEALALPVPRSWLFDPRRGWRDGSPDAGALVICKPCCESSSIGVDEKSIFPYTASKVDFLERMSSAFRQPILVQDFIHGYEVEIPVFPCPEPICPAAIGVELNNQKLLGDAILSNSTIISGNYGFYDFSGLDPRTAESLKATAEAAYTVLGLSGLARVDFRVTPELRFFINDFNTPPHLTDHSSCWFAFNCAGLSYSDLMASLVTVGRINSAR
jgi:D-alanine-D-alanine ligase